MHWKRGPLNSMLLGVLPAYVGRTGDLDIRGMAAGMGISHQALYRWFVKGRLTPANVTALCALAAKPDNVAMLEADSIPLPTVRDFDQFVYAAA